LAREEVVSITGFGILFEAELTSAARIGLGGTLTCPIRGFDYDFHEIGEETHSPPLRPVKRSLSH
jgi:hypothetical protein